MKSVIVPIDAVMNIQTIRAHMFALDDADAVIRPVNKRDIADCEPVTMMEQQVVRTLIPAEATGRRGVLPPLHKILVRDLGVTLMELLNLREPVNDNVTEGMLVVAPLRISRGVGSPANPLLIS